MGNRMVTESRPDWSNMSKDVLLLVLNCLGPRGRFQMARVCKSWRQASVEYALLTTVHLSNSPLDHQEPWWFEDTLSRSGDRVLDLRLDYCDCSILRSIASSCPLLERLNCYALTDLHEGWTDSLNAFVRGCPEVRHLQLWPHPSESSREIVSDFIRLLVTALPNLTTLYLGKGTSDEEMRFVAENAHRLKVLDLNYANITAASLREIGQKRCDIRSLSLTSFGVWNDHFRVISTNFPQLQVLKLMFAQITVPGLVLLGQNLHRMRYLQLPFCNLSNDHVYAITENFRQLQVLDLTGAYDIRDASLNHIGEKMDKLQILVLMHCYNLTKKGVNSLRSARNDITVTWKCHALKRGKMRRDQNTSQPFFPNAASSATQVPGGCPTRAKWLAVPAIRRQSLPSRGTICMQPQLSGCRSTTAKWPQTPAKRRHRLLSSFLTCGVFQGSGMEGPKVVVRKGPKVLVRKGSKILLVQQWYKKVTRVGSKKVVDTSESK